MTEDQAENTWVIAVLSISQKNHISKKFIDGRICLKNASKFQQQKINRPSTKKKTPLTAGLDEKNSRMLVEVVGIL